MNVIQSFGFLLITTLFLNTSGELIILKENNWSDMLNGEWMVQFYAPWCPACKSLSTDWKQLAYKSELLNIKVARIDVTESPGLSGRFLISALPTIYHVSNSEFRQYKGSRDINSLVYFIEKKQWQAIEKMSSLKHPSSIHMSILSSFFKLSHELKELNNQLDKEFGLPVWVSYCILAVIIIILGCTLTLIFICLADLINVFRRNRIDEKLLEKNEDYDLLQEDEDDLTVENEENIESNEISEIENDEDEYTDGNDDDSDNNDVDSDNNDDDSDNNEDNTAGEKKSIGNKIKNASMINANENEEKNILTHRKI